MIALTDLELDVIREAQRPDGIIRIPDGEDPVTFARRMSKLVADYRARRSRKINFAKADLVSS